MGTRMWNVSALVISSAFISACAADHTESTGTISAAIQSTTSDGSVYRLPSGTNLAVYNTGGTYGEIVPLDADTASITHKVPTDSYNLYLSGPAGVTTDWTLQRTKPDNTVESVPATLVTPLPITVNVAENAVVPVVFTFQAYDGGVITFSQGTLDVSVTVNVTDVTGGRATAGATNFVAGAPTFSPEAPTTLQVALPAAGASVYHTITVIATGPWALSSSTVVCAPGQWGSMSFTNMGVLDTVLESVTASTTSSLRICVVQNGSASTLVIQGRRDGAPTTGTWSGTGTSMQFFSEFGTYLAQQVFDGTTLDLGALSRATSLGGYLNLHVFNQDLGATEYDQWFSSDMAVSGWIPAP